MEIDRLIGWIQDLEDNKKVYEDLGKTCKEIHKIYVFQQNLRKNSLECIKNCRKEWIKVAKDITKLKERRDKADHILSLYKKKDSCMQKEIEQEELEKKLNFLKGGVKWITKI